MGGESGEGEGVLRLDARVEAAEAAGASVELWLDWDARRRTRMAVTLSDGRAA